MAHITSALQQEQKKLTLLATSLSLPPGEMRLVLRSYTEIRKKLHQTLQGRLSQGLNLKLLSKIKKTSPLPFRSKVRWYSPKKKPVLNLRVEARIAPIRSRPKTELSLQSIPAALSDPLPPLVPEHPPQLEESKVEESEEDKRGKTQRKEQLKPLRIAAAKFAPLKDAAKDREWVAKAREFLLRDLATIINLSNGMALIARMSNEPFRFFIAKGNNSKLVRQLMKARPGWVQVKVMQEANFVWSQRREIDFIAIIPVVKHSNFYQIEPGRTSLTCPVKYYPPESKFGYHVSIKSLGYDSLTASPSLLKLGPQTPYFAQSFRIHNRLEANFNLTNKKALYWNMKRYYRAVGEDYSAHVPLTFHVAAGESDPEFGRFVAAFESPRGEDERNIWIVKPGENSNQGHDIVVCCTVEQVRAELRNCVCPRTGKRRTFVIQKYIEKPFLYCRRKFDIRCYAMITCLNGVVQGYFYAEGYIRTSSKEFSLKNIGDKFVHLTNDAVQKTSDDYGKFESGNKISYGDFQKYLDTHCPELQANFQDQVLPQIKQAVLDTFKATFLRVDPNTRNGTFEVLGYDFMLDAKLRPILIEVNTNPCLALVSPLLLRIIPAMLDGALRIVVDSLFVDTSGKRRSSDTLPDTKWELLFHSLSDGQSLLALLEAVGTLSDFLETDPAVKDLTDDEDTSEPEDLGN